MDILEKLSKLTESENAYSIIADIEAVIRKSLAEEQLAIANYKERAVTCKALGYDNLYKLFNDIAEEEVIHVGELEQALSILKLDYPNLLKDGEKETDTIFN